MALVTENERERERERQSMLEIKKKGDEEEERKKLCSLVIGKGKFSRPRGIYAFKTSKWGVSIRVISCTVTSVCVCVCVYTEERERRYKLGRSLVVMRLGKLKEGRGPNQ